MKVSLKEIRNAFDSLINESKAREAIFNWAQGCMLAGDNYNLEYDPPRDEDKIWKGIGYLLLVDSSDIDGNYFYSIEDFVDWKENIFRTE